MGHAVGWLLPSAMFTRVMRLPMDTLSAPPQSPMQVAAAVSVGEGIEVAVGVIPSLVGVGAWVWRLVGVEDATGVPESVGDPVTVDEGAGVAVTVGIAVRVGVALGWTVGVGTAAAARS